MLKIQVLGSGLVPRIGRLAPIKDPFPADKTLIGTIFATSKMKINYLHPRTNKLMPLTRNNFAEVWDEYGEEEYVSASASPVDPSKVETKKQQEAPAQKNEIPEKEREVSPVVKEEKEKSEDEILEEMLKEDEKNKADKNNKKKH